MKAYHILFEFVRLLIIGLFIYTACSKLIGYYRFWEQLHNVPFLKPFAGCLSIVIPAAEIIIALLLLYPKTSITGWWFAASLMSLFTIYIAVMMLLSPRLPCSCGGIISALSWKQHLLVNILLAGLCWTRLYRYYFIEKFSMHTKGVS
jgi:hypothetical protein